MCDKIYTIDEIKEIATPIAQQYGVSALYLFGSYARGEATAESDIDFRIEKGSVRTLFRLAAFELSPENIFQKKVEILTTQMLSQDFLLSIKSEEVLVYAAPDYQFHP